MPARRTRSWDTLPRPAMRLRKSLADLDRQPGDDPLVIAGKRRHLGVAGEQVIHGRLQSPVRDVIQRGSAADLAEVDDSRVPAASREHMGGIEVAVREHGGAPAIAPPERRHGMVAADESAAVDRDRADQRQVAPCRDHGCSRRPLRRDRPPWHRRRHHEGAAQQPVVLQRDDLGHRRAQPPQLAVHPGLRGHRLAVLLREAQEQHMGSAAEPVDLGRSAAAHAPHGSRAAAGQQPAGDLADGGDPGQPGPVCYAR